MQTMVICIAQCNLCNLKFYIYDFLFDMSLILRGISPAVCEGLFFVLLGRYCCWCLPYTG